MATRQAVSEPGVPISAQGDVGNRAMIALEASWEIESMARLMLTSINRDGDDLSTRGMTIRIVELAGIIMSALQDQKQDPSELRSLLSGEALEEPKLAS